MWADAVLVAAKDLRLELRSRVLTNQIAPVAVVILMLFGFGLDADVGVLEKVTPGLYWVTVLLMALLAIGRSVDAETTAGARDMLRLSGLDPAAIFLGKAAALVAQLLVLEIMLLVGVSLFFHATIKGYVLVATTVLLGTIGLAAIGSLYGALTGGAAAKQTLLPLLFLPAVAPVLLGAVRAFEGAFGTHPHPDDGWPWVRLLGVVAIVYTAVGTLAYGPLLEGSDPA